MEPSRVERNKRRKKKKRQAAVKKLIPVLVAIVLIIAIVGIAYGGKIVEKYRYSGEYEDPYMYFEIASHDEVAIIMNNEHIEDRGRMIDGFCYLPFDLAKSSFTNHFYINSDEGIALYTTATQIVATAIGEENKAYTVGDDVIALEYAPFVNTSDGLMVSLDYLRLFVPFDYQLFSDPNHLVIYTKEIGMDRAVINKDTKARHKGGVKSEIIEDLPAGTTVNVIEEMEEWAKVMTPEGKMGYVEKKRYSLGESAFVLADKEVTYPLEYTDISSEFKINMAFHQIFSAGAEDFNEKIAKTQSVNVIAPTFFRLNGQDSVVDSVCSSAYMAAAKNKGLAVWAVWTDVDSGDIDVTNLYNTTAGRKSLIDKMIKETVENGIDGINIDFEKVTSAQGEGFVEFLRELSIETHRNGIVLSVDNYAPTESSKHYNRQEQGKVCDYLVVMGYDEHWGGGSEVGSVASINFVEEGIVNTKASVPASKIINAVPFYTRIWASSSEITSQTVGMIPAKEWFSNHGLTPEWSSETCQYYGEYTDKDTVYRCWLEDVESIQVKLNIMETQEVAGVAEWKLGLEDPEVWSAIADYVSK